MKGLGAGGWGLEQVNALAEAKVEQADLEDACGKSLRVTTPLPLPAAVVVVVVVGTASTCERLWCCPGTREEKEKGKRKRKRERKRKRKRERKRKRKRKRKRRK